MTANYPCDLHGHTNRSDGSDTPVEFIRHAAERGMTIAAITDHDVRPPSVVTVDGVEEDILSFAEKHGVRLLRGIEISCETHVEDTHLVCFGCDWSDPYFDRLEASVIESKINSYKELVEKLTEAGMPMTWEEILDNNGRPVTPDMVQKKMIFELMGRKGYTKDWQSAKLFIKESPALSVAREKPTAVSVLREIHRVGGIVIMAHPHLVAEPVAYEGRRISRREYIDLLIDAGLDGIEARYTYDKTSYRGTLTPEEIEREIKELYAPRGLIISAGSDYHADGKKGVKNPRDIGDRGLTMEEFMADERLVRLLP
ncbi:PHP domain-containing protein [Selenomonas sp. TAMA-11512]|uniref:PHP domain-containing protein n=1 Tax=Selenomonas sp. TAMA-11512 TaxID=3095337 RepID=UPI00308E1A6B|nr:PHP domain-containing protein [Selenomonas sp. TAMA-11512]